MGGAEKGMEVGWERDKGERKQEMVGMGREWVGMVEWYEILTE